MDQSAKLAFEQIFVRHYERLTGSKQSVGGLAFSLENIVCFILLGGRELAIEDIYGDVSERYSLEAFLADTCEAGIPTDEYLEKALKELVAKNFVHEQPDGKFYSYQATRDTARMLNKIYPKMQGLSLLAYIGQTIQEVTSGRIDIKDAVSRFDQTLNNHGVPLPKPKIPVIKPPPKPVVKKEEEQQPTNRRIIRDYVVTDSSPKTKAVPPRPAAVPAAGLVAAFEKEVKKEAIARKDAAEIKHQTEAVEEEKKRVESPQFSAPGNPPAETQPEIPADKVTLPAESAEQTQASETETIDDDDEIAAKVAAFETELALNCPICKTNVLTEKKTAAGKIFYSCTSDKCNFISWGRPHHIQCVRCKNPFLVEVADSTGQLILKCPRATCQHRQALAPSTSAGAGVKVVRKRLVRRKV